MMRFAYSTGKAARQASFARQEDVAVQTRLALTGNGEPLRKGRKKSPRQGRGRGLFREG